MREHGGPRIGGVERLSAPRRRLQQSEQLGERAEGFLRAGLDLLLGDRIQTEFVHLPAALALSEDLPPRSGRRRRLASQNPLGAGVHAPAAFRVAKLEKPADMRRLRSAPPPASRPGLAPRLLPE